MLRTLACAWEFSGDHLNAINAHLRTMALIDEHGGEGPAAGCWGEAAGRIYNLCASPEFKEHACAIGDEQVGRPPWLDDFDQLEVVSQRAVTLSPRSPDAWTLRAHAFEVKASYDNQTAVLSAVARYQRAAWLHLRCGAVWEWLKLQLHITSLLYYLASISCVGNIPRAAFWFGVAWLLKHWIDVDGMARWLVNEQRFDAIDLSPVG